MIDLAPIINQVSLPWSDPVNVEVGPVVLSTFDWFVRRNYTSLRGMQA